MRMPKRTHQNVVVILLLLIAVLGLFRWYSTANSRRIQEMNLSYAADSTRQTALNINNEFSSALLRVRNFAYLLGDGNKDISVSVRVLQGMEENASFDSIRFVDTNAVMLGSDGQTAYAGDLELFTRALRGESDLGVVASSPLNGQRMMAFCAPVWENKEISGVLVGVYRAEEYLRTMLETDYFGEPAGVYLCDRSGQIIASSGESWTEGVLPDLLRDGGVIDAQSAEMLWTVFGGQSEEGSFLCAPGSGTDNLCALHITGTDYILVQTFPQSVTQAMVRQANGIGMILQGVLMGLFILYILFVIINNSRERRKLERENKEMGYVINGVTTLFSRFILVDLEAGTYRFLAGTIPERAGLAPEGAYEDFSAYLCELLAQGQDKEGFAQQLTGEAIARSLEHASDVQYEYKLSRSIGITWEHINIVCLERRDGRPSKVMFLRQNVTDLKEKELKAQAVVATANRKERQYRIAITSTAFSTFEFNLTRDLVEQDVTRMIDGQQVSLLERVGLRAPCPASACFEKWQDFVLPESLEEYRAVVSLDELKRRFEQGEAEVTVDYWGKVSESEQICVRQSFVMTRDDDGDIMVMVVSRDITAQVRKQREQTQALQDALMQAQHANSAKTTFLSNMSHDIRTPMNAIIGFTTLAITHIDNKGQVQDCLQKVLSSSNHLLSLINDILDMSRIESGKIQILEQECNISELTHNLVNIIQPQVKAKQLDLFIDTFDVNNEDVITDSLKLSQVFVNLLSNAVKYTPAGGTVSFRIQQETTFHRGYGDYVFIVKDTGIGMAPEFVEHIFEPFEREASTTKTGIQGTGLGMAITKNIVEMMGGTIQVHSVKGKGSEFRVELSLKLQDVERNAAQIKELEGLRALVVDDDCDSCESVTKMLGQIGMRSEWTVSGREAVHRAKSAHNEGDSYHTYIIDWQMPEMSGIETTRRIRAAIGNEAPIIILTAYDWTTIEEEAKEAGVTAFCAKPLFMSDLKSVLLAANDLGGKAEEPAPWTQADFGGKRVLVVEDNELNREIAQSILEETGFVVDTAPDGTDAVDRMRQVEEGYYDAILMDVQMPVMDGYEATRTIRGLPRKDVKTIPIIAMTANAMEEDREAALENGMNAHIAKPLNIDLFLDILKKYLG